MFHTVAQYVSADLQTVLYTYTLPNIVRVVKPRRMKWAGHVARRGEDRGVHRVLVGKPEGYVATGETKT